MLRRVQVTFTLANNILVTKYSINRKNEIPLQHLKVESYLRFT